MFEIVQTDRKRKNFFRIVKSGKKRVSIVIPESFLPALGWKVDVYVGKGEHGGKIMLRPSPGRNKSNVIKLKNNDGKIDIKEEIVPETFCLKHELRSVKDGDDIILTA